MPAGSVRTLRRHCALALVAALATLSLGLSGSPAGAAALAAPTGLSPDAVTVTGIPVLAWDRVTNAQSYTVEVSTSGSFDTVLWTQSTTNRKAVPNRQLGSGTVYWRVRAVAGSGNGSWSVAAFDRDPLAGPTPLGPAPGTVLHQPHQPALVSWTPTNGAVEYTVQVGTDAAFTDPTQYDEFLTQSSSLVVPIPQVAQPYHWRVRATLGNGIVTQWSDSRDYEIRGLTKPVLVSPADGPFTDVVDVVLDWAPVLGAKSYNLQVSTDQNFSDTNLAVSVNGIVSTRFSPQVTLGNDQYYWRVQPVDAQGNTVDWASVDTWTFRRHWPDQPTLQFPADDAVVGDPFHLQWTPVNLASEYTVQLSTTSDFNVLADQCTTAQTTYVPTSKTDCFPNALGTYYWRVFATDTPGLSPDGKALTTDKISAEVRRFTYAPGVPTQLAPSPGATVEVPTLSWSPVPGANSYRVTISSVDGGDGTGTFNTTGTTFTPRGALTPGKSYRWQVQTVSLSGRLGIGLLTGDQPTFSVAESTATPGTTPEPGPPPAPSSRFPTLTWTPVTDATNYRILVRASGGLAWTTLTDKFNYPAGEDDTEDWLTPGSYEWMVEAYQGSVWMASSVTTATFTITALDAVSGQRIAMTGDGLDDAGSDCRITLPDRCTDLRHTPVLGWDAQAEAGTYKVWLTRDEQMTSVVPGYPVRVENNAFIPIDALPDSQAGTGYYWFVQPCKTENRCKGVGHPGHAFNKLSKPVQLLSPDADATMPHDLTFTWRDYLLTNQDPTAFPLSDPSGVHTVAPRVEAMQYRIQVSPDASFDELLVSKVVDQTTFTSSSDTLPEGPLYWRVRAIDGNGNDLTWSAARTVTKASPSPTLLEPLGGVDVSGSVPLRWEPLPYAASYDVEVYRDGDTTASPVNRVERGNSKQVAYSPSEPLPAATLPYTWRVRPVDAKGKPGAWTDLADPQARFVVSGAAPTLLDPAVGVYVHANDALFSWQGVDGASSYRFERRLVGSSSAAETISTPGLAWAPKVRLADGGWEWRVSSLDAANQVVGASPWRGFRVDSTPPALTSYGPTGKVPTTTTFVVRFSEPVSSVHTRSFKIYRTGSTTKLLATVVLNPAGTRATLDPVTSLKSGKKYTIKLNAGVRDPAGNRLVATSWTVTAR